ncbi:hypothetical protein K9U40_03935 [Xanthobacter autotrophicus]|uniref:hypothetical protein n=1 Tax=Xanthobacter TaxID=279 RepID=UPI0024AB8650|nr:hypothetical protein [Xanthobacter autotrophicus]MDI4663489.1 hypothetical protein [Xanthobacter autotrophicus]
MDPPRLPLEQASRGALLAFVELFADHYHDIISVRVARQTGVCAVVEAVDAGPASRQLVVFNSGFRIEKAHAPGSRLFEAGPFRQMRGGRPVTYMRTRNGIRVEYDRGVITAVETPDGRRLAFDRATGLRTFAEVAIEGNDHHAEMRLLSWAKQNGRTILALAPTRGCCATCNLRLRAEFGADFHQIVPASRQTREACSAHRAELRRLGVGSRPIGRTLDPHAPAAGGSFVARPPQTNAATRAVARRAVGGLRPGDPRLLRLSRTLRVAGPVMAAFDAATTYATAAEQWRTGEKAGAAQTLAAFSGRMTGALIGAEGFGLALGGFGSVVPGFGTTVGALTGAVIGGVVGAYVGEQNAKALCAEIMDWAGGHPHAGGAARAAPDAHPPAEPSATFPPEVEALGRHLAESGYGPAERDFVCRLVEAQPAAAGEAGAAAPLAVLGALAERIPAPAAALEPDPFAAPLADYPWPPVTGEGYGADPMAAPAMAQAGADAGETASRPWPALDDEGWEAPEADLDDWDDPAGAAEDLADTDWSEGEPADERAEGTVSGEGVAVDGGSVEGPPPAGEREPDPVEVPAAEVPALVPDHEEVVTGRLLPGDDAGTGAPDGGSVEGPPPAGEREPDPVEVPAAEVPAPAPDQEEVVTGRLLPGDDTGADAPDGGSVEGPPPAGEREPDPVEVPAAEVPAPAPDHEEVVTGRLLPGDDTGTGAPDGGSVEGPPPAGEREPDPVEVPAAEVPALAPDHEEVVTGRLLPGDDAGTGAPDGGSDEGPPPAGEREPDPVEVPAAEVPAPAPDHEEVVTGRLLPGDDTGAGAPDGGIPDAAPDQPSPDDIPPLAPVSAGPPDPASEDAEGTPFPPEGGGGAALPVDAGGGSAGEDTEPRIVLDVTAQLRLPPAVDEPGAPKPDAPEGPDVAGPEDDEDDRPDDPDPDEVEVVDPDEVPEEDDDPDDPDDPDEDDDPDEGDDPDEDDDPDDYDDYDPDDPYGDDPGDPDEDDDYDPDDPYGDDRDDPEDEGWPDQGRGGSGHDDEDDDDGGGGGGGAGSGGGWDDDDE